MKLVTCDGENLPAETGSLVFLYVNFPTENGYSSFLPGPI